MSANGCQKRVVTVVAKAIPRTVLRSRASRSSSLRGRTGRNG